MALKSPITPSKLSFEALVIAMWTPTLPHPYWKVFLPPLPQPTGGPTLSGHDEAGHAVRHTGPGCQEGDPHDDVRNPQCVTDDCDLEEAGRGGKLKADSNPPCPWILWPRKRKGRLSRGQCRLSVWRQRGRRSRGAGWGCRSGDQGAVMELMFSNQRLAFFICSFQLRQMAWERKNSVWGGKAILG